MRAPLLALLVALPALAGCAETEDPRGPLVPYPQFGQAVAYDVTGSFVDFARWENAHPFPSGRATVRYELSPGGTAVDATRALHDVFRVGVQVDEGGGRVAHATRFVSPAHQLVVQSWYPLSQDQGVVAFDERGYPWLWGASVLVGEELTLDMGYRFTLPDNLGLGREVELVWRVQAREEDGTYRVELEGNDSVSARLWMEPSSAWPVRVEMTLHDDALAPFVRVDAAFPATLVATRASQEGGLESVPPRNRDAGFLEDAGAGRAAWNGEAPPDGEAGYVPYALHDAIRDSKLLDPGLRAWLDAADEPRLYRGTFKRVPVTVGPANVSGQTAPYWLLQFMEKGGGYWQVEVERVEASPVPGGVPRVARSGPAEPPRDPNHGWFPRDALPQDLVTLSEGVRMVREVFGATEVEIFLRSFAEPPGYSYYIDGGFGEGRRYTVVVNPGTGRLEGATGFVTPRVS